MMRINRGVLAGWMLVMAGLVLPSGSAAQEPAHEVGREAVAPESQHQATSNQVDIAHHIGNAHEVETPFGVWHLPDNWKISLGTDAHGEPRYLDLSPTRHLVYMVLAAVLVALIFIPSARIIANRQAQGRPPKGFPGAMEAMARFC